MTQNKSIGKVIIAGAGPGDPDLITLKAANYLGLADVVITDRLVSDAILEVHARKDALVLHVGKQRGNESSTPQPVINELMVEYALQGKQVVRLKGGDVSIFSNILDELRSLIENHIDFEIVPGVTAALGAAAYAGIPLTARGFSTAVRLLTYYKKEEIDDKYWIDLARTDDTLVFYMSAGTIDSLIDNLLCQKIAPDKHIAIIEQASTPFQRVTSGKIHDYPKRMAGKKYVSPALIIVGRVAALHEEFSWFLNMNNQGIYFSKLEKTIQAVARA